MEAGTRAEYSTRGAPARSSPVNRFSAAIAAIVLLWATGASCPEALAQPFSRPGYPGKGTPPGQPVPTRQAERPPPERQHPERLSPEERRQLRRDIEQHGREIYPDPRRGRGDRGR
jgi:hypothetical protein